MENKAQKLGVKVNELTNNYISKPAMTLLNRGMQLEQVRKALDVTQASKVTSSKLDKAMDLNGRKRITVKK